MNAHTNRKTKTTSTALPKNWPATKIEARPLKSLLAYAQNPRMHSDSQIAQLAQAINEYGWTMPCLIDEDDTLIAGHGRILAGQKLGLKTVPVMVARGWSEAQRRAYRIWDNQSTLLGVWDTKLLTNELQLLEQAEYPLMMTGFDDQQLVQFMAGISDRERTDAENAMIAARLAGLKYAVIIECDNEQDQAVKLTQLEKNGFTCRALIS
jgi:ParB-like chromosome segregation protein Spo0J